MNDQNQSESRQPSRMPVVFIGHGNPMNAIEDSDYSRNWEALGRDLPRPKAIACISAHWLTDGPFATAMEEPRTIHDFYGFPQELFEVQYPAPGSPAVAARVSQANQSVQPDLQWGLDHGTWSVLKRMYPAADIPVVQVSVDVSGGPELQYELGKTLRPLRNDGILFVASGNIVHNLGVVRFIANAEPYDWAVEFDEQCAELLANRSDEALIHYRELGEAARMSIPTDDHYRPILAALGLSEQSDPIRFFNEGIDLASIGMRSFVLG
ncbi:MAG TPA: 4,5-DOPA dioxygenase extradiol [Armatimonadota bacterium]|jgi:4,5-DOPA dioxygenase extradiol